jgi:glycosyltransferase involved in cell wall biosynthesis
MKDMGFKRTLLWICTPLGVDLLNAMDAELIIYHCTADFSSEKPNSPLRKETLFSMENELARRAGLVLAMTEQLYKKFKSVNANTHLFQSAVDDRIFSFLQNDDACELKDMTDLKRPRVGVIGYLDGRVLDVDLLAFVADTHREWSVVLIGPMFRHVNRLRDLIKRKNIRFLGEKAHEEIPRYIKGLDVCLIPYGVNEFTDNVSPLKLYEYMALGKPVVCTNLSYLEKFRGLVRISDTREGFAREIELSLKESDKALADRRRSVARSNSWGQRVELISRLIEAVMGKKAGYV